MINLGILSLTNMHGSINVEMEFTFQEFENEMESSIQLGQGGYIYKRLQS